MTAPNYKELRRQQEKRAMDLAERNLHQAEIRLKGEETNGIIVERGLVKLLLDNANDHLSRIVRTVANEKKVKDMELRIAEAHRLRAALDCRLQRNSFRLVNGGEGVLS